MLNLTPSLRRLMETLLQFVSAQSRRHHGIPRHRYPASVSVSTVANEDIARVYRETLKCLATGRIGDIYFIKAAGRQVVTHVEDRQSVPFASWATGHMWRPPGEFFLIDSAISEIELRPTCHVSAATTEPDSHLAPLRRRLSNATSLISVIPICAARADDARSPPDVA